ncbi:hypothetical protein BpHYR1_041696 [Brachionus plicatilis]|uniref:Uncharacterized protein n=1 Tax=Brachionus plicatilis TaxID=10195 RepID=A0A3M7Q242_BRAPC|nr:hypothetical protein BpHYR1_041696 [Brachionus plicatilis]
MKFEIFCIHNHQGTRTCFMTNDYSVDSIIIEFYRKKEGVKVVLQPTPSFMRDILLKFTF